MLGGNSATAFYYAHNPDGVRGGSNPRLAGLDEAERQRMAWRLAFEYLRRPPHVADHVDAAQHGQRVRAEHAGLRRLLVDP